MTRTGRITARAWPPDRDRTARSRSTVLAQVETEEFNRYRADVQSRFKLTSDELLAELERRIAADRETRVQGAEDKALNEGKKILLAITFSAERNEFRTRFARGEAADPRPMPGVGARDPARTTHGSHSWRSHGARFRHVAGARGHSAPPSSATIADDGLPLGETRLVRAAITEAATRGYEWIVKVCGDVFHPHPGWAKEMVRRAMASPNGAALVTGICNNKCTVTKVFAARTDFLARTWPEDSEVAPLGAGAVLERIWTAKIERLGLTKLWLPLPCRQVLEGKSELVDADRSGAGATSTRTTPPSRRNGG